MNPQPEKRHPRREPEKRSRFQRYKDRHKKTDENPFPIYGDGDGGDFQDCFGKFRDMDLYECQVCVVERECLKAMMGKKHKQPRKPSAAPKGFKKHNCKKDD